MNNKNMKKNININYMFISLMSFSLTEGVWMLYLASKGLSLFEIGLMESIFHITSFLMEVPTGIVADIYGRKISRSLGRLMAIVSTIIMIFGKSPLYFALGFIFAAISYNLESGAGDALIYDSMKELGSEKKYMKVKGNQEVFFQIANASSLLLGGYLATLDYGLVYKTNLIIGIVTFMVSLSFVEPRIYEKEDENTISSFYNQIKKSIKIIIKDKRILFLIIIGEFFSNFYTTEFFYIQNLLKSYGYNEFHIGLIISLGGVFSALVGSRVYLIEKKLGPRKMLMIFPLIAIICFWGVTFKNLIIPFFMILSIIECILFITISDYINRLIPSKQRATILSFQSMAFSLIMIIFFPIIGKIGDLYGLDFSFKFIAAIATLVLGLLVVRIKIEKDIEEK
ncbi:MAG: MFS transporter [Clostridiaceae bacterium]